MRLPCPGRGVLLAVCAFGLLAFGSAGALAQSNPDFDAVTWTPLTCAASPLTALDLRAEINLVGDAVFPAAYTAHDATYLYFRYRVDGNPMSSRGFLGTSDWTTLIQVPAGDPFQYQYQVS